MLTQDRFVAPTPDGMRWLPAFNASGQIIPPFGCVVRIGPGIDVDGNMTVGLPTADNQTDVFFAGPGGIAINQTGAVTANSPYIATYNSGTPADGDTWGAAAGSFYLKKGNTGFEVIGPGGSGLMNVLKVETGAVGASPAWLAWNAGWPVIGGPVSGPGIYFAIMQNPSPPNPPINNFSPQIQLVYSGTISTGSQTLTGMTIPAGVSVGQWFQVDQEVVQLTAVTATSITAVFRNSHSGPVVFFAGPVVYLQNNNGLWPLTNTDIYSPNKMGTCGSSSTLHASINNSVTSLQVASAASFPTTVPFQIYVDSEIMLVTTASGTTFTVTRAYNGSSAASHTSGATVFIPSLDLYGDPQIPTLCRGTSDQGCSIAIDDTWIDVPSGNDPASEISANYPENQFGDFLVHICGYVSAVFSSATTMADLYAAFGGNPFGGDASPVQVRIAGNDAEIESGGTLISSYTGFSKLANCGPTSSQYPQTLAIVNDDGVNVHWMAEFHFVWRANPTAFPFAWQLQAIRHTASGSLAYTSAAVGVSGYYWEQIHNGQV